jgi:ParB-like chromosome segregation protein Spo0J
MKLKVVYLDPKSLKPRINDPRTHTAKQIRQIAASIKEFDFLKPVVLYKGTIAAGHGTTKAAILLERSEIPTVTVDHLTPAQSLQYIFQIKRGILCPNTPGWLPGSF